MGRIRKLTSDVLDRAEALRREDRLSLIEIGKILGVHPDNLSVKLRERGFDTSRISKPAHNRKNIPSEMVDLYKRGESVLSLSKKYGVNRWAITRRLIEGGIQVRNKSESGFLRVSSMSTKDRQNLVKAAVNARMSGVHIRQKREKRDGPLKKTVGKIQIGVGEPEFQSFLKRRKVDFVWQYPTDSHYLDFRIGSIAVELIFHSRSFTYSKYTGKRMKETFDRGLIPVLILFKEKKAFLRNLKNILSVIQQASLDPPSLGQYWVVRCYMTDRPIDKGKLKDIAVMFSSKNFFITTERRYFLST